MFGTKVIIFVECIIFVEGFTYKLLAKLLGVIINENLKWNCHVDYITAKASKKLHALKLL